MAELNPDGPVILSSSIALLLFGGVWLLFAVPYVRGLIVGLRSGNWWSPFEKGPRGTHGLLARSRFFASFRAPEPTRRTSAGLRGRWAFWAVVLLGLGWYPLTLVVRLIDISRTT